MPAILPRRLASPLRWTVFAPHAAQVGGASTRHDDRHALRFLVIASLLAVGLLALLVLAMAGRSGAAGALTAVAIAFGLGFLAVAGRAAVALARDPR